MRFFVFAALSPQPENVRSREDLVSKKWENSVSLIPSRKFVLASSGAISYDAERMNQSSRFFRFWGTAAILLSVVVDKTLGQVVIAPTEIGGGAGSSGSSQYPISSFALTLQFMFDPTALGLTSGDVINGIAFRRNEVGVTGPAADITYTQYDIKLGPAATTPATMSDTFASNFDTTQPSYQPATVKSGGLTIGQNTYTGGSTPNAFGPVLTFDTPFTYQGGTLLIQINSSAPSAGSGFSIDNDAGTGYATDFQAKFTLGNSSATTASFTTGAPVTQFTYTPVPEPATYGLLSGLGLGAFALVRRIKRS